MQLQYPSSERYAIALSMAGLRLLACIALDIYSSQTLASLANLTASLCVFASLSALSGYMVWDLWLPPRPWAR
jgi:hypothetical protein